MPPLDVAGSVGTNATPMGNAGEAIATATRALAAGDVDGAVETLVALWAELPSTRIAALVEAASARLPREELPAMVNDRETRWRALAAQHSALVVPSLLAVDWPILPGLAVDRIEALRNHPPDPRLARALRELWLAGRYRTPTGRPFWKTALRMLLAWKDPELAATIAIRNGPVDERLVANLLADLDGAALPAEPELGPEVVAALDEHGADARPPPAVRETRAAMFAAVHADPTSDEPRLVLADLLAEEGDPRGELIPLMHALEHGRGNPKMAQRVRALLRNAGTRWLDGLRNVRDPSFRCGFVSKVTFDGRLDPEDPSWTTVETLVCGEDTDNVAGALVHPHLRHLRHLDGVRPEALRAVAAVDRELERLGFVPEALVPIPTSRLRIRHLRLHTPVRPMIAFTLPELLGWFDRTAFRRDVRVIEVTKLVTHTRVRPYFAENPQIESFRLWPRIVLIAYNDVLGQKGLEVRLSRDVDGVPSLLEIGWHAGAFGPYEHDSLLRAVDELGGPIRRVVVRTAVNLQGSYRDAVLTAAREATNLEPTLVPFLL